MDLKEGSDDSPSDTFEPDIGETIEVEVRIALHFFLKWICNSITYCSFFGLEESRKLREEQDSAYLESLRIYQAKVLISILLSFKSNLL